MNNILRILKYLPIAIILVLNISTLRAMDNTIALEIYTEKKSQSLESYHRRIEKLQTIVNSYDNIKKVNISQNGYVIKMMVMQKIFCEEQPLQYVHNMAHTIEQKILPEKIKAKVIFYPDNRMLLNWTATQRKEWKHLEY